MSELQPYQRAFVQAVNEEYIAALSIDTAYKVMGWVFGGGWQGPIWPPTIMALLAAWKEVDFAPSNK